MKYQVQDKQTSPNACPDVKAPNECVINIKDGNKNPVDFEVSVTANEINCGSDAKKNQE